MQPPYGEPGTVVRIERNRAVVLWLELDYLARHSLASLTETANQSMIGRQGADVAQSSGDNGRNREHHAARCLAFASESAAHEPSRIVQT